MPYHFSCPHCGSVTLVEDQFSGQSGPCVACGKTVQVPNFAAANASSPPAPLLAIGKSGRWLVAGLIGLMIAGGVVSLIRLGGAAAVRAQATSARGRCMSNLQKIADALNAYADDHGAYPPPYVADTSGKPLLSWRVTILPYLGHQDLYNQIHKLQSWDSVENVDFMYACPKEYQSPGDTGNYSDSSYMLVTGNGTLFPTTGSLGPRDIGDGPEKTLLVAETARPPGGSVPWMKPVDLDIARMTMSIGGSPGVEIGGTHTGGATIVTADGRAHFLRDATTSALIRSIISPNGGEAIRDDALD